MPTHPRPLLRMLILLLTLSALVPALAPAESGTMSGDMVAMADCGLDADHPACGDEGNGCSQHAVTALPTSDAAPVRSTNPSTRLRVMHTSPRLEEPLRPPIG